MARILLLLVLLCAQVMPQATLRDKIGQMIMVGFSGTTIPDTLAFDLANRGLGGVIFFAANIQNPAQFKTLSRNLQLAARTPLLLAVDQEGGQVARLNQANGYARTNSAYRLGTTYRSLDSTVKQSAVMAQWLQDAGVNVDFAPVVDVNVNPSSPAIGAKERSFSKLTNDVFSHARAFITEMSRKNVITALKHFPGHGSAASDSHLGFTDVTATWADSELIPYRQLFSGGYHGMVMSGHLFNSRIDSLYPASLSYRTITAKLRGELGFSGVVITDELFMAAISANYAFDRAIELAVLAGNDILLFSTNIKNNRSLVDSVTGIILSKIAQGKISEARIDESYNRIRLLKQGITAADERSTVSSGRINGVAVYPNPASDHVAVLVSAADQEEVVITVYSLVGSKMMDEVTAVAENNQARFMLDTRPLAAGVYVLRVASQSGTVHRKLIILH